MELYLDDPQGLPKFAAAFTRLSESANDWQSEIIDELYRQAPYVGDFEPRLVMNELDPERRYALGSVELSNRMSVNPRDENTSEKTQGIKRILVPVVVKDGKMSPLDVFVHNGKTNPLTEARLRKAMFRPELFEAASRRTGDQDLMSTLYPPHRSGGLGGGGRVGNLETAKTGSARVIDAIHHTVKEADVKQLEDALNGDRTLQSAVIVNPAVMPFLQKVAEPRQAVDSREMMKRAMAAIPPKVVQIQKIAAGFRIKTANPDTLAPEVSDVGRPEAEKVIGKDLVRQVERDGTVTVATDPVVRDSLADAKIKIADEFGEYKVKTKDGDEVLGWVFPRVVDLDGVNIALAVFTNGKTSGLQENIAGSFVGKGTNLIDVKPNGVGVFYLARQGGAVAIEPMDIKAEIQTTEGHTAYKVKTVIMGKPCQVKLLPGLSKIEKVSDTEYCIPEDCGFIPLKEMTSLAEDADEYVKTAQAASMPQKVDVMFESGGTFSMRGMPLEKMAHVLPMEFIDRDQAVFNLAILGVEPSYAKEKLAEAKKLSKWCSVDGVRPVTLAAEKYLQSKTAAAKFIEQIPDVKRLMIKEAATLDDPLAVDKVLSIGFLNPENIGTFISYLPEFEDTLSKLSELLVASRLGLNTVDVGALERVVKHLDKVISGLRELTQHPSA